MNASVPGAAIAVENIVKRYGDFEAVKGVTFEVGDGEIFGLLGPNGAGKSTLIRMMTTLIPVSSGRAIVAGHDVSREPDAVRRVIGVIPQALTSDIDLTVEENLSIYAKLYESPEGGAQAQYRRASRSCGPDQVAWCADQDALRRHAAAAGDCARAGSQSRESSFSTNRPPGSIRFRAWRCGRCWIISGRRTTSPC